MWQQTACGVLQYTIFTPNSGDITYQSIKSGPQHKRVLLCHFTILNHGKYVYYRAFIGKSRDPKIPGSRGFFHPEIPGIDPPGSRNPNYLQIAAFCPF